ncbi:MAG: hypothetical protein KBG64_07550 [Clostridia bacterium]|nr:hypothetical protein [Clostridia bacterium]
MIFDHLTDEERVRILKKRAKDGGMILGAECETAGHVHPITAFRISDSDKTDYKAAKSTREGIVAI